MEYEISGLVLLAIVAGIEIMGFIPWFIALLRGHRNATPIFLVCLFFNWTCIGWIIAFIWAFSSNVHYDHPQYRPHYRSQYYNPWGHDERY